MATALAEKCGESLLPVGQIQPVMVAKLAMLREANALEFCITESWSYKWKGPTVL